MRIIKVGLRSIGEKGPKEFLKKICSYFYNYFIGTTKLNHLIMPSVVSNFKVLAAQTKSIEDAVNLAFSFNHLGISIKSFQLKEEITRLLRIVEGLKPKIVLEIGGGLGGTLFLLCKASAPDATIISINFPEKMFLMEGYPTWKDQLLKSFAGDTQNMHLIRANSHDVETINKIKNILGNRAIDFCFIDGDHSYEGVKRDFEMYSPLVKKGGTIAFHDIITHHPRTGCEVDKFWREIKTHGYQYREIIENKNQNWAGIGVLYM